MNSFTAPASRFFYPIAFVCCIILSVLVFYPFLYKNFASDDFFVLNRLCLKHHFWIPGFFRPVNDITFIWTYKLFDFKPFYYYAFNIILHGINGFLILLICKQTSLCEQPKRVVFGVIAALLFITYPFHMESIAWVIARGSSLGTTFAFLSLICLCKPNSIVIKSISASLFFFIGIACYENIFLFPLIAFLFLYHKPVEIKKYIPVVISFSAALIVHISLRIYYSNTLWGEYGNKMFTGGIAYYFTNFFKTFGRLFIPPTDNTTISIVSFISAFILFLILSIALLRRKKDLVYPLFANYIKILLALFVSLVIPFLFGVSTHTSEGDRLLYFPSAFWAIMVSFLLIQVLKRKLTVIFITGMLLIYQLFFLQKGIQNWLKSSETVQSVLNTVKNTSQRPLYIINLPDEYNGAYIFRNGFSDALQMYQIDTAGVTIVNHLTRADEKNIQGDIKIRLSGSTILIPPVTNISYIQGQIVKISTADSIFNLTAGNNVILFWNKLNLEPFDKPIK